MITTAYGFYRNRFMQALDVASFLGIVLLPVVIVTGWIIL